MVSSVQNSSVNTLTVTNNVTVTQKQEKNTLKDIQVQTKTEINTQDNLKVGAKSGVATTNIKIEDKETPDSSLSAVKKLSSSVLLGGSVGAVANVLGKAAIEPTISRPSISGIAVGVAIGSGIALLNIKTNNKTLESTKNVAGSTLIGVGAMSAVQSVSKSIFTETVRSASPLGIMMGGTLAGGIALANTKVENKTLNMVKNATSGALIGGSAAGIATAVGSTFVNNAISKPHLATVGLAIAVGAGIGILNSKE